MNKKKFLSAIVQKKSSIKTITAMLLLSAAAPSFATYNDIHNDTFWKDVDGNNIYSQGGGIFRFADTKTGQMKYYWYGVHYKEAELYASNPSSKYDRCSFVSVSCYSSDDLINWKFEGDVLTNEEVRSHERAFWVGRMGVAYLKDKNIYALFVQFNSKVLIATCNEPNGNYQWHRTINMTDRIGTSNTGDQTVFTDEDTGLSYLIYSYGKGRNRGYISKIGINENGEVDLLDCHEVYKGSSREGNCMFKYKGKYYLCASNIYGWDCSYAYYLVADNIYGPYLPTNDMKIMRGCDKDYAHVTQTGFFVTVHGTQQETVVYCGDRWSDFAGNGWGYNQWVPLSFEGDEPIFNSFSHWRLDAESGLWTIGTDNDYVMNGSFEADRNAIPSARKPVQEQLLGWDTEIVYGNKLAVGDSLSPQLNYFNTIADCEGKNGGNKAVRPTGEKSLNITDNIDFERVISQKVSLPNDGQDASYQLSVKVKAEGDFSILSISLSGDSKNSVSANLQKTKNSEWQEILLDKILLKGNASEVNIVIHAKGKGGSRALIDDIVLKKI